MQCIAKPGPLESFVKLANALDITLAELFSADTATPPVQPGIKKRRDH